jgi:hypothetical protein
VSVRRCIRIENGNPSLIDFNKEPIRMKKYGAQHGWTECTQKCGCGPANGTTVVYLADNEQVVCWQSNLKGRLDDPNAKVSGHIDGLKVFIMNTDQRIEWLPGKTIDDYRRSASLWDATGQNTDHGQYELDPFVSVCKLINAPFPAKLTDNEWQKTAVIIIDMWDRAKSQAATSRLQELAPEVDKFVSKARSKGALIIHSPATLGNLYQDKSRCGEQEYAARQNALAARLRPPGLPPDTWERYQCYYIGILHGDYTYVAPNNVPSRGMFFDFIVNPSDGGPAIFETTAPIDDGSPRRQHIAIKVDGAKDALTAELLDDCDAYKETLALTKDRPYIIYVGVDTNWCLLRRFNAIRSMYKAGKSIWMVRDMTDSMAGDSVFGVVNGFTPTAEVYTGNLGPGGRPIGNYTKGSRTLSHFQGTDLVIDWMGWNFPGTRTATRDTEFPDLKRFRFQLDGRGRDGEDSVRIQVADYSWGEKRGFWRYPAPSSSEPVIMLTLKNDTYGGQCGYMPRCTTVDPMTAGVDIANTGMHLFCGAIGDIKASAPPLCIRHGTVRANGDFDLNFGSATFSEPPVVFVSLAEDTFHGEIGGVPSVFKVTKDTARIKPNNSGMLVHWVAIGHGAAPNASGTIIQQKIFRADDGGECQWSFDSAFSAPPAVIVSLQQGTFDNNFGQPPQIKNVTSSAVTIRPNNTGCVLHCVAFGDRVASR